MVEVLNIYSSPSGSSCQWPCVFSGCWSPQYPADVASRLHRIRCLHWPAFCSPELPGGAGHLICSVGPSTGPSNRRSGWSWPGCVQLCSRTDNQSCISYREPGFSCKRRRFCFATHATPRRHSRGDSSFPHISKQPGGFVDSGVCLKMPFSSWSGQIRQHKWKWHIQVTMLYLKNNI